MPAVEQPSRPGRVGRAGGLFCCDTEGDAQHLTFCCRRSLKDRRLRMGFFAELKREWPVIFTAPRVALTYAAGAVIIIWSVTHWEYAGIVSSKDEQIKTKQEALILKDEQIKFVERQRDDYKEKLGGATPSEAKARIEELEKQLKMIEPRIAQIEPRRLSEEQKTRSSIMPASHQVPTILQLLTMQIVQIVTVMQPQSALLSMKPAVGLLSNQ